MSRRSRLAIAHVPWHIVQRGHNGSACFCCDDDYRFYMTGLREQALRYECAIHAYVLMTDHVHLLLTPSSGEGASLLMKHVAQRYAQYVNRRYQRSGSLWEGRFRSCLAQNEDYVLACYRYIELNPVRAEIVAHPRDYRWSSFRANGEGAPSHLLTPHAEYLRLGRTNHARQHAYRALIRSRLDEGRIHEIRRATNGNFVLGSARFQREMAHKLKRRVAPGKSGRPARKWRTPKP